MLLQQALDAFLLAKRAECSSEYTALGYKTLLSPLIRFLDNPPIEQITSHDLRSWIVSLREQTTLYENHPFHPPTSGQLSEITIRNSIVRLKTFFRWLFEEDHIERNPAEKIKIPKKLQNEPPVLEPDQIISLVQTIDVDAENGARDLAIFLVLLSSGIRIAELCTLGLSDVDLNTGTLQIFGKGKKKRTVFLFAKTLDAVKHYVEKCRPETVHNYLWVGRYGGRLGTAGVTMILKRLKIRAGLADIKFSAHVLRHTYATLFVENGGDSRILQLLLGHNDLTTTAIYTHPRRKKMAPYSEQFGPLNGSEEGLEEAVAAKLQAVTSREPMRS
ncbi:MAG: tyrosine-type recombinase/integrase [Anaerolineae bacterium]|nr:tyrosine-type recombinase/integrase [Anaerolineae bacterium]